VGTHACGVVVSRNPLEELVPLQHTTKDENAVMAAFEGPTLAKMGLLKMDILGLANLSIVAEALKYIEQTTGKRIELADIPLDDRRTFESLGRGETTNVFQLESAGMTRYLTRLKPTRVDDLYAMVALYRPGPLEQIDVYIQNKNNPRGIKYLHPILKPILEDTYGVIVYQEQIMQLLQAVADYTLGEAYIVIKAISKKNKELMAENEVKFKDGCIRKGIGKEIADQLWELILPFAGYSFNRPHSTLYGLLSYQTAWLKTNHPTEYMAAVLTAAAGQIEDVAKSVAECGRLGVAVLPADVNRSNEGFTIEQLPEGQAREFKNRQGIRFGLSAIRNVGSGPVHAIIAAREKDGAFKSLEDGAFKSLEDFCDRVDRAALNKRVLESLIKCGAMDSLPGTRHQKLAILDQALSAGIEAQRSREAGQSSMFDLFGGGGDGEAPSIQSIPMPLIKKEPQHDKEMLAWEKELLGMYISDHPVARALEGLDMTNITTLSQLSEELVGHTLTFVGMLSQTRRLATKKGDSMLVATLEDLESAIELVAFPKSYEKYRELLIDDAMLCIKAKVDKSRRDDSLQLMLESAELLESSRGVGAAAAPPPQMDLEGRADDIPAVPEDAVVLGPAEDAPHPALTSTDGADLRTDITESASVAAHASQVRETDSAPAHSVAQPAQPAEQPISIIKPRVKVGANGNGNGHANGNGHGSTNGYAAPPEVVNLLRVYLPRSSDLDADVALMHKIDRVLRQSEGDDQVIIHMPNSSGTVLLKPRHKVRCSDDLVGALQSVLGGESVHIER
jgi:DNA polymerase-3 subunit alpha